MVAAAGVILFYLASANSFLALFTGTCTQGGAGQLGGGFVSLALFAVGGLMLRASSAPLMTASFLIPTAPILVWQTIFSATFFFRYWLFNVSACDVLKGYNGQAHDGGEPIFTVVWVLTAAVALVGIAGLAFRWRELNADV